MDHAIFLARDQETEDLVDLVAIYRGVLLYGASGDGKSSLINAAVLPAMVRRRLSPERVRVQPRQGEEIVIERVATTEDEREQLPSLLANDGDDSPRMVMSVHAFEDRVRKVCQAQRPLLIFDQFEEIITMFEQEEGAIAVQRAIVDMLVRLLREPLAVKLLFVFREDYLGKAKDLLSAVPELVDQALRLRALRGDALPTIIRGPFERHPGHFAREFDSEIARRACKALVQRFGSSDISLSEVQTVCLRLWQVKDPEALLADRGVQGLLEDYLGEALDAFPDELRGPAVALLGQMVTSAGTRNVISAHDLVQRTREAEDIPPALLEQALKRLETESKLVRRERRRELYLYEITSEFLVPWINRRRQEFYRQQERARERRRLRLVGSIAVALLVVAAVIAGLAVWALQSRTDARLEAVRAQRERVAAISLALASSAQEQVRDRLDVSLRLALEAYRVSPHARTRSSMLAALEAARRQKVLGIIRRETASEAEVAFSPDRRTLAYGDGKTIRFWNLRTHRRLDPPLSGYTSIVTDLAFSPDGRTLASAHRDEPIIRLWDVRTHRQLRRPLTGHTRSTERFSSDVNQIAFSTDGRTLASAGSDKTIRLWDVGTHRQRGAPLTTTSIVLSVAFSPNDRRLVSMGGDGTTRIWDVRTHKQLGPSLTPALPRTERTFAGDAAFSSDGRTLVLSDSDGTIRRWDARTRTPLGTPRRQGRSIFRLFSPDGRRLASMRIDGTIRVWDVRTHRQLGSPLRGPAYPSGIAFSADGRTLASTSLNKTVWLWDLRPHAQLGSPLSNHRTQGVSVAFSPAGHALASASLDHAIRLWDVRTHRQLRRFLTGHTHSVRTSTWPFSSPSYDNQIAFSPDGRALASAGTDKKIRLWDVRAGRQLGAPLAGHTRSVQSVAFSPSGRTLASAGVDKTIRLWDVRTHRQLGPSLSGHTLVWSVAFSPDGNTLASGGNDGTIRLWDSATHRQLGSPLNGHTGLVWSVAFSPDSRSLASGGAEGTTWLWNVRTHRRVGTPLTSGSIDVIRSVVFSPDGHTLASGGDDGTIRLWDVAAQTQLGSPLSGHGGVSSVAFSPDGRHLASADLDSTRIWTGILWRNLSQLRNQVCSLIGTGLSKTPWAQYAPGITYHESCP